MHCVSTVSFHGQPYTNPPGAFYGGLNASSSQSAAWWYARSNTVTQQRCDNETPAGRPDKRLSKLFCEMKCRIESDLAYVTPGAFAQALSVALAFADANRVVSLRWC